MRRPSRCTSVSSIASTIGAPGSTSRSTTMSAILQPGRVDRPARAAEEAVRAAVMPHASQPGADEHSADRARLRLRSGINLEPAERVTRRSGLLAVAADARSLPFLTPQPTP